MNKALNLRNRAIFITFVFCITASSAVGQSSAFTYQGKLSDSGTPQSTYQMRFELYDALTAGNHIGATVTDPGVTVSQGVFTTRLDFGAAAFDGTERFLEIAIRSTATDPWTVLTARQQVNQAPYSIKSMNAAVADSLSAACAGCVLDANIADVSGSKVTGQISPASVPTGSGNYIQNAAAGFKKGTFAPQQAATFNIDGNGIIGDSLGIGIVPRAGIKLDVIGTAIIAPTGASGVIQFGNPNSETGISTVVGSGRTDFRYDGSTLKLVAGFVGGPPPSANGIMISNAGNVGIGVAFPSPLFKLSVTGNGSYTGNLSISGGATVSNGLNVNGGSVSISNSLTVFNGATLGGNVSVNSGNLSVLGRVFIGSTGLGGDQSICRNSATGALADCSSSLRYKSRIESFGSGMKILNRLRPISYSWKQTGRRDVGLGAEDVARIDPLFVTYNDKGEVEGVKYDRMIVVFVNAFKEQQAQIDEQQQQILLQQRQIEALTRAVSRIRKRKPGRRS